MLGPGLNFLYEWSYLSFIYDPIGEYYSYTYFKDEKTEAQYNLNTFST